MKEQWKPLPLEGTEGHSISNKGRVRKPNGKIKKTYLSPTGARRICFKINGKRVTAYVGRMVALAFIPGAAELFAKGYVAHHKNLDTADDRVTNISVIHKSTMVKKTKKAHKIHLKDNEEEVYQLWYEGYELEEIKDKTGVAVSDIRDWLREKGLRKRSMGTPKWYDETKAKIRKMYWVDGMNIYQIQNRLGFKSRTIIVEALDKKCKKK